jgi:hypothetical protein
MRSLLGDFEFLKLQEANLYLGPMLFIVFVVLAVFVVLNMLIAIISDAYIQVEEEIKSRPKVDLLEDVKDYLIVMVVHGNFKRPLQLMKRFMPATVKRWIGDAEHDDESGEKGSTIHPAGSSSPGRTKKKPKVGHNTLLHHQKSTAQKKKSTFAPPARRMSALHGKGRDGGSLSEVQLAQMAALINKQLELQVDVITDAIVAKLSASMAAKQEGEQALADEQAANVVKGPGVTVALMGAALAEVQKEVSSLRVDVGQLQQLPTVQSPENATRPLPPIVPCQV